MLSKWVKQKRTACHYENDLVSFVMRELYGLNPRRPIFRSGLR